MMSPRLMVGGWLLVAAAPLAMADSFVGGSAWAGLRQLGYPALAGRTVSTTGGWEARYGWSALSGAAHEGPHRVVERLVFYDRSAWDAEGDQLAVAPDKVALLPDQQAVFANYTSYSRGINGIMVDIEGLLGTPTADDFEFRVGNTDATATWNPGPLPASISVLPGAGTGGSDRVVLIWGNDAARRTWLEVRVRATLVTGLAMEDVFYFGNAVGETGNQAGIDAVVDGSDESRIRANVRGSFQPATKDNLYDINRDRLVNATDQLLARGNVTDPTTALRLIRPTPGAGGGGGGGGAAPGLAVIASSEGSRALRRAHSVSAPSGSESDLAESAAPPVGDDGSGAPVLRVMPMSGGRVRLSYSGVHVARPRLESSVDGLQWGPIAVEPVIDPEGGSAWELDTEGWGAHRWFRLRDGTVER